MNQRLSLVDTAPLCLEGCGADTEVYSGFAGLPSTFREGRYGMFTGRIMGKKERHNATVTG